jgi:hypothetical protein
MVYRWYTPYFIANTLAVKGKTSIYHPGGWWLLPAAGDFPTHSFAATSLLLGRTIICLSWFIPHGDESPCYGQPPINRVRLIDYEPDSSGVVLSPKIDLRASGEFLA